MQCGSFGRKFWGKQTIFEFCQKTTIFNQKTEKTHAKKLKVNPGEDAYELKYQHFEEKPIRLSISPFSAFW